jgi:amino acid adenylation domain-containing protein
MGNGTSNLSLEQQSIRNKCFHPEGEFILFKMEEVEQSISERFENTVRRYPNRAAVKTRNLELTYNELNEAANRVAWAILERQGEGNEPIALLLEQGATVIAAIIGLLKAGKIYVPLDPSYPLARLRIMLGDSQASAIVTNHRNMQVAQTLAQGPLQVINIEDIDSNFSAKNPSLCISHDAFAYIFYTSGSTGQPKGVVDTHRNVLHNIMRYTNSLHVCAVDRLTLLQSCSFSGSVSSLFSALLNGAAVFPFDIPKEGLAGLGTWLLQEEITIYHSVPSIFRHVPTGSEQFPQLRLIRLEGDQVSLRDFEIFKQHFASSCILVNGLGATECGLVRQYFMDKRITVNRSGIPIGYAVEDMDIVLLDDASNRVDTDSVGEIAVRSRYLATGYWKRPDLTRASFSKVPNMSDLRVYRTGDLGRLLADGCLEYLGRKDFQMKIRGQQVDLAEVETALLESSMIKEATIQTHDDSSGEPRLLAYVVPSGELPPTVSMLRKHLEQKLPSVMIPSGFVVLDHLPLTPNGKLDRQGLPSPNWKRPELDTIYVAPRTQTEKVLGEIWADVLRLDQVGLQDNFFDLGGDSLRALEIVCAIDARLGCALSPEIMARASTIRELALLLEDPSFAMNTSSLVPIRSKGTRPPLFCVPGVAGTALAYWPLARQLNQDQPVFAFEPTGLDGIQAPDHDVETMAARYVADLRELQPAGPYYLAGTCFGSTIAFEMARQLGEQDQEVAIVFLFGDNLIPEWVDLDVAGINRLLSIRHAIRRTLYHLGHSSFSDVIATARNELRIRFDPSLRTIRKVLDSHLTARSKHRLIAHNHGRIVLFRIGVTKPAGPGQWSKLAQGGLDIEHVRVPAERWMQEPYVVEVADAVERHLYSPGSAPVMTLAEPQLSLVIPCYNESAYLEASVSNLLDTLDRSGLRFELVLFDDGSSDDTAGRARALLKVLDRSEIRLLEHLTNLGRGATVADGLQQAAGEVIGFCDIDLEISAAYIPGAVRLLLERRCDMVVAERHYRWTPSNVLRNVMSIAYRRLVRLLLCIPDADTGAGFKFFRRSSILPILDEVHDSKWFWDTEVTVLALDQGLRLVNLPAAFERRRDKKSTVRLLRDTLQLILTLVRFHRRRASNRSNSS